MDCIKYYTACVYGFYDDSCLGFYLSHPTCSALIFFPWGGDRAGGGVGRGLGAIIFICDTLYQPNTHCLKFS